ncbi:MAG: high-potential iron-sulfur protein [Caldimonas sp.]
MTHPNRRAFVLTIVAASPFAASLAAAQAAAKLEENDPQAVALGYKADSTKVDKAKYPQHAPTQVCSGCNFYQGKPTDAMAPCQIFANKQVPAKAWCSAYVKKA